ncbi:hypothetical protein [Propionibacterium phage pa29399-1-D_1]|nr:hypothetical protein [Propionibacterium phage pa29399-1-D_1]
MCHPWVMFLSGLSGLVVVVSRVCRLQPGVKAALISIERFMEGVSGVTDVTEAFIASLSA